MEELAAKRSGLSHLSQAMGAVLTRPTVHAAQVAGALVTFLVAPLWGSTFPWMGWLEARRRLPSEGLIAFGAILAPAEARAVYRDGVWRGLWRVHGISVAIAVLQLPVVCLALLPAAIAYGLLMPAAMLFPDLSVGMAVTAGLPALLAYVGLAIVAGQTMLTWRLLTSLKPPYPLGLVYVTLGATWRTTLREGRALAVIGLALLVLGLPGALFIWVSLRLASWLALAGGASLIGLWSAVLVALVLLAVSLEALARWAETVELPPVQVEKPWSFTEWLVSWLGTVFRWFAAQGFIALGTAACLIIGLLTGVLALVTGQTFSSWVGLGWFTVTAAVLVTLRLVGRQS